MMLTAMTFIENDAFKGDDDDLEDFRKHIDRI